MPKRMIDYEAVWSSGRLSECKPSARVEYLWIYGIADAGGSFELSNIRAIWGQVAAIRPDLTMKKLKMCLDQYEKHGLLFSWEEKGKKFGHWVGSRKPGRLPKPSHINRYYLVCPQPPVIGLEGYESRFRGDIRPARTPDKELELELELEGNRNGVGIGFGIGAPAANTAAIPAQSTGAQTAPASPILGFQIENHEPRTNCKDCGGSFTGREYLAHPCPAQRERLNRQGRSL
jgi:hypothetical protein